MRFKVSKCRVGDAKSRDVPACMAVQQKVFSVEIAVRKDLIYSDLVGQQKVPMLQSETLLSSRYCESCWPGTYFCTVHGQVMLPHTRTHRHKQTMFEVEDGAETFVAHLRMGYHLYNGSCLENYCSCQNGAVAFKKCRFCWAIRNGHGLLQKEGFIVRAMKTFAT